LGTEIFAFHEYESNIEKLEERCKKNFKKNSYGTVDRTQRTCHRAIIGSKHYPTLTFLKRYKITVFFFLSPLLRIFVSFVIVTTVLLLVAVLREPECHRGE